MSATQISVQGVFGGATDRTPSGQITFRLTEPISSGGIYYPSAPQSAMLDASGRIIDPSGYAFCVPANDDSATTPAGTAYAVTTRITGQAVEEFTVVVAAAATATDTATLVLSSNVVTLASLVPSSAMIGKPISGSGIPIGATVTDFAPTAGTVTISAPATSGGASSVTIGGAVTFTTLQEDSQ